MRRRPDPSKPPSQSPRAYALGLLARREYSAHELRERLVQRGYDAESVSNALERLASDAYQSDQRYAESQARLRANRSGDRVLRQHLKMHHVDEGIAQQAVAALPDEQERASAALQRFEGKLATREQRDRATRFLMRRGFGWDAIRQAMRALTATPDDPEGVAE